MRKSKLQTLELLHVMYFGREKTREKPCTIQTKVICEYSTKYGSYSAHAECPDDYFNRDILENWEIDYSYDEDGEDVDPFDALSDEEYGKWWESLKDFVQDEFEH